MQEIPRWTVDELIAKYELEPCLADIYVEGVFDQEVISHCLHESNVYDRIVYDINSVEIPSELLKKHNLTNGNKQRVIALAKELRILSKICSYICFVDKDLDHWIKRIEIVERLIYTKFCSIELYFFSSDFLKTIIVNTANSKINDWNLFFNSFLKTLKSLYSIRLANHELNLSLESLCPKKCLEICNGSIKFDNKKYIERLLHKNNAHKQKEIFLVSLDTWEKKLKGDERDFIHGHDLIFLIAWSIDQYKGIKEFQSEKAIQRMLIPLVHKAPDLISSFK